MWRPRGEPGDPQPTIFVDTYLAWSPAAGGSRIAVKTSDCRFDYAIGFYHVASGEFEQKYAGGADCCGYAQWTDFFFGPTGQFGYTKRPWVTTATTPVRGRILYPGFASRAGDTGGAPSPSGRFMAFTSNAGGNGARDARQHQRHAPGATDRRLPAGLAPPAVGRRPDRQ